MMRDTAAIFGGSIGTLVAIWCFAWLGHMYFDGLADWLKIPTTISALFVIACAGFSVSWWSERLLYRLQK